MLMVEYAAQLSPAAGSGPVRAYHLNSDSGTLSHLWHAHISLISTLYFGTERWLFPFQPAALINNILICVWEIWALFWSVEITRY